MEERLERRCSRYVFLGELFVPGAGIEDLGAFQTWYTRHRNGSGESPSKAKFLSFDLLTAAGRSLHHRPYEERYQIIPSTMRVAAAPYQNLSEAEAAVAASNHIGCEGFVFWDADASSLCKIEGQNKARGAAWKVKPVRRESFALRRLACVEPARLVMVLGTHGQPDFSAAVDSRTTNAGKWWKRSARARTSWWMCCTTAATRVAGQRCLARSNGARFNT